MFSRLTSWGIYTIYNHDAGTDFANHESESRTSTLTMSLPKSAARKAKQDVPHQGVTSDSILTPVRNQIGGIRFRS